MNVVDHAIKEDIDFQNVEGLSFSVKVPDPEITAQTTATVAIKRENTGDEQITVGTNPDYPYPRYSSNVGEADSFGIVLVSPKTHDLESAEPGCWGPEPLTVIFPGDEMVLDPGESIEVEYDIWAEPTEERRCIQPGTYSFDEMLVTWTLEIADGN